MAVPLSEAVHQVAHTLIRSRVALCREFSREARHVVTLLFPPLADEWEVRIKLTGLFTPFALGKSSSLYPLLDRAVADSYPFSHQAIAEPLLPQCYGLFVAGEPLCPTQLHGVRLQWREIVSALALQCGNSFSKHLRLLLARGGEMTRETALHGLAEIFEQVPLVGHLESLWSPEPGGGGIGLTAIPAHDFNRGVSSEPGRHRCDLSIRQDTEPTMPFQVTDECPIAVPRRQAQSSTLTTRGASTGSSGRRQSLRKMVSGLQSMAKNAVRRAAGSPTSARPRRSKTALPALGPARIALSHSRKSFGEGLAPTRWVGAEEAMHPHHQPDAALRSLQGKSARVR